jgi:protein SCO1
MIKRLIQIAAVLIVILVPVLMIFTLKAGKTHYKQLPFYGNHELSESGDTAYHTIPAFSLFDQDGNPFTEASFDENIVVADFFFTSCPGICPVMTSNMKKVQDLFASKDIVKFVSFTVDPKRDTPEKLKEYGIKNGADLSKWSFLTGDKTIIYELARNSFFINAEEADKVNAGSDEDFIHGEHFVLLDKSRRIRGYYAATDSVEVERLKQELVVLLQEYDE